MTSNYKLKQDCKATLNSIRDLLSQEERQKVEPHLRQILELTKSLVENAKVSPEKYEALATEVGTLTKERTRLSDTLTVLRRDLDKASKLKEALATLESEKDSLGDFLTDMICGGLELDAAYLSTVVELCGNSGILQWIDKKASSDWHDAKKHPALLAVCLTLATVHFGDEIASELLTCFRDVANKQNGIRTWGECFSTGVKAAFTEYGYPKELSGDEWWWLAVNGASCSVCLFPARAEDLEITPVPERMIGFHTQEEQLEIQHFLLTAPIEDVDRYMASLPPKIRSREVGYVRLRNPELPTHDSTMWSIKRPKAV